MKRHSTAPTNRIARFFIRKFGQVLGPYDHYRVWLYKWNLVSFSSKVIGGLWANETPLDGTDQWNRSFDSSRFLVTIETAFLMNRVLFFLLLLCCCCRGSAFGRNPATDQSTARINCVQSEPANADGAFVCVCVFCQVVGSIFRCAITRFFLCLVVFFLEIFLRFSPPSSYFLSAFFCSSSFACLSVRPKRYIYAFFSLSSTVCVRRSRPRRRRRWMERLRLCVFFDCFLFLDVFFFAFLFFFRVQRHRSSKSLAPAPPPPFFFRLDGTVFFMLLCCGSCCCCCCRRWNSHSIELVALAVVVVVAVVAVRGAVPSDAGTATTTTSTTTSTKYKKKRETRTARTEEHTRAKKKPPKKLSDR